MKTRYLFTILFLAGIALANAQTAIRIDNQLDPLSPSEKRFDKIPSDMELRRQQGLYSNPAYYGIKNDSTFTAPLKAVYKSGIVAGFSAGEENGDYLLYEGNKHTGYRINGFGEYSLKAAGTIYGAIQYARGTNKNIGWNAVRYPELYLPYITTDSVGGNYDFETYSVKGGYSFRLNNYIMGVSGEFRGEQAHRNTDPRGLNNTTWLHVNLGIGCVSRSHLFMFRAGYERNKQYMHLRYWRPGQQDRFFVSYGFGLYDAKHSRVSFGYSRMFYIDGFNAAFTWQSPADKKLSAYGSLQYKFSHMKSEESDIRDLYFYDAHRIHPAFMLNWKAPSFHLNLLLESNTELRKGSENIFEQYKVDDVNNVYDYRLIDTQQNYDLLQSDNLLQLKAVYPVSTRQFELIMGASLTYRSEKYKAGNLKILNSALLPHAGVGYKQQTAKSEWDISALYIRKLSLDNEYNVSFRNTDIEHLDFQYAFSPYAYYNSTYSSVQVSFTYLYKFRKHGLGTTLKFMYTDGKRDKDCVYTREIGFDSDAPKLSTTPDKHNELWGSAAVFWVF